MGTYLYLLPALQLLAVIAMLSRGRLYQRFPVLMMYAIVAFPITVAYHPYEAWWRAANFGVEPALIALRIGLCFEAAWHLTPSFGKWLKLVSGIGVLVAAQLVILLYMHPVPFGLSGLPWLREVRIWPALWAAMFCVCLLTATYALDLWKWSCANKHLMVLTVFSLIRGIEAVMELYPDGWRNAHWYSSQPFKWVGESLCWVIWIALAYQGHMTFSKSLKDSGKGSS